MKFEAYFNHQGLEKVPVFFHKMKIIDYTASENKVTRSKKVKFSRYGLAKYPAHLFYKPISKF